MAGKKIIIIGSGPGGVSAGMLLAHKGYDVTLYEKKPYVGGRNGSITLDEYTFDIGPTFFMMTYVLQEIFTATGRNLDDYVKLVHLDPMYRLVFPGGRDFYPSSDDEKMKEEIERVFPGNSAGYDRYMAKERKKYDTLIPCLQVPYQTPLDFLSWQFIRSLPYLDAHVSLFDVLGRYFNDDDLKTAFTFQAKYIGMSPWTAPGTFSIISYIEHGGGIYHVKGGLNRLSAAGAKVIEEEGGQVLLNAPVKRILTEKGRAIGVELEDGHKKAADYVVLNADFGHAMTHLVDEGTCPKYTDARLRNKLFSCSTFMLYLGVNKEYREIPHHSIVFSDDYKTNVHEITDTLTLSDDPSFYVQNASVTDPTLAPSGKSALYVLVPVPNNKSGIDWEKEKLSMREKVLNLMETKGGYRDLRNHIEVEKIITPADWENEKDVYLGATFNLGHNVSQMLLMRPHNQFEQIRDCYLVGGGTHPGSGLPTIYESARISAGLIMKRDGIS